MSIDQVIELFAWLIVLNVIVWLLKEFVRSIK